MITPQNILIFILMLTAVPSRANCIEELTRLLITENSAFQARCNLVRVMAGTLAKAPSLKSLNADLQQKIIQSLIEIVDWAHANKVATVIVSGRSGPMSSELFVAAWQARFPEQAAPTVLDLGTVGNKLLYKYIYPKEDRKSKGQEDLESYLKEIESEIDGPSASRSKPLNQYLIEKGLKLKTDVATLYLDSYVNTGTKGKAVLEQFEIMGYKDVRFAGVAHTPETPASQNDRIRIGVKLSWPELSQYE